MTINGMTELELLCCALGADDNDGKEQTVECIRSYSAEDRKVLEDLGMKFKKEEETQ